jgi:hypothetical protein
MDLRDNGARNSRVSRMLRDNDAHVRDNGGTTGLSRLFLNFFEKTD